MENILTAYQKATGEEDGENGYKFALRDHGWSNASQVTQMENGTVIWYDFSAGHGLIAPASGGESVVVLYSDIMPGSKGRVPTLFPADEVEFEIEDRDQRRTPYGVNLGPGSVASRVNVISSPTRHSERYPVQIY
jgi:cold shock CspA family protein